MLAVLLSKLCALVGHFPDQNVCFLAKPGETPPVLCSVCYKIVHKYKTRTPHIFIGIDGAVTAAWLRKKGILPDHKNA